MIAAAWLLSAAAAFSQEYGVVNVSVCNMRDAANFSSEMVSQSLLGTPVHILSRDPQERAWPRIQTPDGYTGWVHYKVVTLMDAGKYHEWNAAPKVVITALSGTVYSRASERSAVVSDVVAGCRLRHIGKKRGWLQVEFPDGRTGWVKKGVGLPEKEWRANLDCSPEAILSTARSMTGFPYLWAGMSPKGMDCSGFVRTVLFMHDIIIPRDAGPQAKACSRIDSPMELIPGDLVFFGRYREDGSPAVSHVGFFLGGGRFIHSLGLVQIGSFNADDPLYDAFNSGRYLFGGRFLPYIDKAPELNTTLTNPYYAQ